MSLEVLRDLDGCVDNVLYRPAGYDGSQMLDVVRQYYYDSYGNIRWASSDLWRTPWADCVDRYPWGNAEESNTVVLLHDAFQPLRYVL